MTTRTRTGERTCRRHRRYLLASCPVCMSELRAQVERALPVPR